MSSDERSYNLRIYNVKDFPQVQIDMDFVDEMLSMSKQGDIRGLHFHRTYQQRKLVRVICGEVFDVAFDVREGLKTFGARYKVTLSAEMKNLFYIQKAFPTVSRFFPKLPIFPENTVTNPIPKIKQAQLER